MNMCDNCKFALQLLSMMWQDGLRRRIEGAIKTDPARKAEGIIHMVSVSAWLDINTWGVDRNAGEVPTEHFALEWRGTECRGGMQCEIFNPCLTRSCCRQL